MFLAAQQDIRVSGDACKRRPKVMRYRTQQVVMQPLSLGLTQDLLIPFAQDIFLKIEKKMDINLKI